MAMPGRRCTRWTSVSTALSESFGSAKKGSLSLATQEISNRKIVTPNATFSESISVSTFVKVAEQLYLAPTQVLK
jgi:hypothetical protein